MRRDLNEDQYRAEWVRFQMFSARRTVHLKARRVEVNQGLDLDLRLENLVITGACLPPLIMTGHILKVMQMQK